MTRIPVGRTIAAAYSFTFENIGTVIGLIWLPLVIYFVSYFFSMSYYFQGFQSWVATGDITQLGKPTLALLAFLVLAMFLVSAIGVSLTRQAMGLRTGPAIVHLGFGSAEFNLFVSFAAAFFVLIAIYVLLQLSTAALLGVTNLAIAALGLAGQPLGQSIDSAALAVLSFAVLAVFVYLAIRLTFLLAPVTVAEGKINLIRAWELAGGNFWRIFVVGLAIVIPALVAASGAELAILGPAAVFKTAAQSTNTADQLKEIASQMHDLSANLPLLLGLSLLLAPFTNGLMFSAPAFAYAALVKPPHVPGGAAPTLSA